MILRIEQDHNRFQQIIRGRIKKELKKYISSGELIGRRGKDFISIPLPQIELPRFVFGENPRGKGKGEGEGEGGEGEAAEGEGGGAADPAATAGDEGDSPLEGPHEAEP